MYKIREIIYLVNVKHVVTKWLLEVLNVPLATLEIKPPSESKKPCFQFNSTSFISLLIYYISFVLRAMANLHKGALPRLKAFSALGLF
jgi:hypothetical protein